MDAIVDQQQQQQQPVFYPAPPHQHPPDDHTWIIPRGSHPLPHPHPPTGPPPHLIVPIQQQQQQAYDNPQAVEVAMMEVHDGLDVEDTVEAEDDDSGEQQHPEMMVVVNGGEVPSHEQQHEIPAGPSRTSKRATRSTMANRRLSPVNVELTTTAAAEVDISNEGKVSLSDLKDCPPGVKPYHAYSTLIRYAIKGSPTGRLLLEDIYEALMLRFEYFRTAPSGWKNSVRHNLSLNPMFVKIERPLTDRGKGYYWTVKDEEGVDARTGVHRNRKKKSAAAAAAAATQNAESIANGAAPSQHDQQQPPPPHPPPMPIPPYPPQPPFVLTDEQSVAAMQAAFNPYPRDQLVQEVGPNGEIDWQASWWNEITKLSQYTTAQENAKVAPDWYRWMFERMRAAFGHPAIIGAGTSTIHVNHLPPPPPPGVVPSPHLEEGDHLHQQHQQTGGGGDEGQHDAEALQTLEVLPLTGSEEPVVQAE